jgi:peptidoglycan/LPS O-acetylase OafA/YrhL
MTNASYRADIDGLRAVAVLSVVVFHAAPALVPGGFVGVDIFFVISGFLISGLIMAGLKDGSFRFLEFYARRVRRLFPALIVVLLAVWGLGWFFMLPPEFAALGDYMLAGASFAANILTFAQIGYFDAPATSKPLLHLWSLGVEEQFYIIFPAMIALTWRAGMVRSSLVALGVASFAANIVLTPRYPSLSFYLPMTRFWEFTAGALLACRQIDGARSLQARDACAGAGLLLILAGLGFTRAEAFPGWWALLPVVGSCLIIEAGPGAWLNREILARPTLVCIGLFSYPLYLWHWPLLVIGRTQHTHEILTTVAAVALAFALSWLTYRFIERPVRARRPLIAAHRITIGAIACVALVALLGLATALSSGILSRYPEEVQALLVPLDNRTPYQVPPADEIKYKTGPMVVLYGDSHAGHLVAGLVRLQEERRFQLRLIKWNAQKLGDPDCSPVGNAWGNEPKPGDAEWCQALTAANKKKFLQLRPDIVVIGAFWRQYDDIERLSETLRFLHTIGVSRIIIVGTLPYWPNSPQALLYDAYLAQGRVPKRLTGFHTETPAFDARLKTIASAFGATYVSAYETLCNDEGCLARLGSSAEEIVQIDNTHFSDAGSWFFISHVADQFFGPIEARGADR